MGKYLLILLFIFSCSSHQNEQASGERNPSSTDDPWTSWSNKNTNAGGLLVLSKIRTKLLENNLFDPYEEGEINYGARAVDCSTRNTNYRSADGRCTNIEPGMSVVGASNVAFGRNVAPEFITPQETIDKTLMTPSPRLVSKTFFTRTGALKDSYKKVPFLNMLAASWIQFMNHDWITHGKNMTPEKGRPGTAPYKLADGFTVEKTQKDPTLKKNYKREYQKTTLNKVTHWWDGSQIYGSNQAEQNSLRVKTFSIADHTNIDYKKTNFGKMRLDDGKYLPRNTKLNPKNNRQNQGYELTGFMDNWWVGLSMLHHLFVKEHNHIASMLMEKYVFWDAKKQKWVWTADFKGKKYIPIGTLRFDIPFTKRADYKYFNEHQLDEHIFQISRLINSAIMAKIHTVEWTPAILANKMLDIGMHANWYGLGNPKTLAIYRAPENKGTEVSFKPRSGWENFKYKLRNKTDRLRIDPGYLVGGIVGDKTSDHGVPYSLTEEFTSVYRLHSLLPENLELKKTRRKDGKITGVETFQSLSFNDSRNEKSIGIMKQYKLSDLFYSFGTQLPGQLVLNNFPRFMQNLDIPGHGKMDLGAVDILRDRERGVPRYNKFRRAINLKEIKKYTDFFPKGVADTPTRKDILKKFQTVYGFNADGSDNVEAIDLLVGSLAEEVRPKNFGFGETPFQIFILMASRRLMADRFYTNDYTKEVYSPAGLEWIDKEGTMHQIIARHMPELAEKMEGTRSAFAPWNE